MLRLFFIKDKRRLCYAEISAANIKIQTLRTLNIKIENYYYFQQNKKKERYE